MSTIYKQRCNDPVARKLWEESGLVLLRDLQVGDVFEDIDGLFWRYDRKYKGEDFAVLAEPWGRDAEPTTFCATAKVRPVMQSR